MCIMSVVFGKHGPGLCLSPRRPEVFDRRGANGSPWKGETATKPSSRGAVPPPPCLPKRGAPLTQPGVTRGEGGGLETASPQDCENGAPEWSGIRRGGLRMRLGSEAALWRRPAGVEARSARDEGTSTAPRPTRRGASRSECWGREGPVQDGVVMAERARLQSGSSKRSSALGEIRLFMLELPVHERAASPASGASSPARVSRRHGRVLFFPQSS
ncbi:hypothetical protein SKAU_G00390190 [Synaphobranchus kaupii]|uniref:Uncharacterized protein n=1 Tax=Synaphobranchus kaupii TaxID=118154 RepID=A0A9Q1EBF2_SYNKA|nr:hypothetical protein SKAU_G00390190 [Synaphobranchus kaupii]